VPLYSAWAFDFILLYWMLYNISTGALGTSTYTLLLYLACTAQHGAINAAMGHEMVHRRGLIHKICGTMAYFKMLYAHFYISHIRSHHKKVATPEDASTSRLNESLYEFFWRTIPDSYVEVWKFERTRLRQQGCDKWWQGLIYNRLITFNVGQAVYMVGIWNIFGTRATVFHFLVSFLNILMFEAINYLEHYGL
jgi:alkane 1-monooxygenase